MIFSAGYCAQCEAQIMVRDTSHNWAAKKANYRDGYLTFLTAPKVKMQMCSECIDSPNLTTLYNYVINPGADINQSVQLRYVKEGSAQNFVPTAPNLGA